jgi:hypothetical protein
MKAAAALVCGLYAALVYSLTTAGLRFGVLRARLGTQRAIGAPGPAGQLGHL